MDEEFDDGLPKPNALGVVWEGLPNGEGVFELVFDGAPNGDADVFVAVDVLVPDDEGPPKLNEKAGLFCVSPPAMPAEDVDGATELGAPKENFGAPAWAAGADAVPVFPKAGGALEVVEPKPVLPDTKTGFGPSAGLAKALFAAGPNPALVFGVPAGVVENALAVDPPVPKPNAGFAGVEVVAPAPNGFEFEGAGCEEAPKPNTG